MSPQNDADRLSQSMRGRVIQRSDADYDEIRKINNAMIDRRPLVIAQPVDVADVIAAVGFAREEGLLLSVRGGGHGVAGFAMNDDGLVIDLSRMKGIRVDPRTRTVTAQGGCTWGDVDHATHAFGMATPGGVVSTTGIAGLTLGGGIGNLTRKCGLSCDNLVSADVVLADGSFVVASESQNPDLFWALRGGGGNFGVVTSFEYRMHEVRTVFAGPLLWTVDRATDAMRFAREFIPRAPEDLNVILAWMQVPPGAPFPTDLHGKGVLGAVVCYAGPLEEAEAVVKPLRTFGPPAFDGLGELPFPALQSAFDPLAPMGLHNYWKADFITDLNDDAIAVHAEFGPRVPNMFSGAHIFSTTGAAQRVGKDDTAWAYRDARYSHVVFVLEPDASKMPQHIEWVRSYWSALHPHSAGGAYVNFLMDEGEDRVAASYRGHYPRLEKIKAKYDPQNLFRMNQNIKPSF
ncbi:MAG: FAD-binding oxidoreductase [Candidatus Eisenbacteria bacterium]